MLLVCSSTLACLLLSSLFVSSFMITLRSQILNQIHLTKLNGFKSFDLVNSQPSNINAEFNQTIKESNLDNENNMNHLSMFDVLARNEDKHEPSLEQQAKSNGISNNTNKNYCFINEKLSNLRSNLMSLLHLNKLLEKMTSMNSNEDYDKKFITDLKSINHINTYRPIDLTNNHQNIFGSFR